MAKGGGWTSEGGPDSGVGEVSVTDSFDVAFNGDVLWWGLDRRFHLLLSIGDRGCLMYRLDAVGRLCGSFPLEAPCGVSKISAFFAGGLLSGLCGICQGV